MIFNIYCYENIINGDVYIGQTTQSLIKRAGHNHSKYKLCPRFYRAVQKYGIINFNSWIFAIIDNQDEANQIEMFWIAEMRKILGPEHVYNLTDGGNNGILSEESKKKISNALIGKPKSLESRQKHSKTLTGRKLPIETKNKMSISGGNRKGSKHSNKSKQLISESIRILTDQQLEEIRYLLKIGIKQKIIAKKFNISQAHISRIKNGKRNKQN